MTYFVIVLNYKVAIGRNVENVVIKDFTKGGEAVSQSSIEEKKVKVLFKEKNLKAFVFPFKEG